MREYTRQMVMTNDEHEAALAAKAAEELVPTKRPSRAGKREASAASAE